jgi:hypothetical protein
MAKPDKDKIPKQEISSAQETVLQLWVSVAKGDMSMPIAERQLHDFVNSLSEEKQAEFREKAKLWARLLTQITEAFTQQLFVIGAGQ